MVRFKKTNFCRLAFLKSVAHYLCFLFSFNSCMQGWILYYLLLLYYCRLTTGVNKNVKITFESSYLAIIHFHYNDLVFISCTFDFPCLKKLLKCTNAELWIPKRLFATCRGLWSFISYERRNSFSESSCEDVRLFYFRSAEVKLQIPGDGLWANARREP